MSSAYQYQGSAQSPQDEPTPSRTETIPLICFICPKNSHFSDLSHLLTHISSKGHLHNLFQLTLSRDVDENAALALAEFEAWYKQNNISALLRARMNAREQRGNRQQRSQTTLSLGSDSMVPRRGNRGGRSSRRSRGSSRLEIQHGGIDDDVVKFESDDDEGQPGPAYQPAHAPYIWQPESLFPSDPNHYSGNISGQFQDYLREDDDSSKYEPSELYSPFPSDDTTETIEDDTGTLVLKGVVYPGMAGFDSATEKDRRMRNQKKDPAVLRKLEANSELVTRVEEVLDTNLDYQRTRDVYDEPSIDGSMDEDDAGFDGTQVKRRVNQAKSSYASVKRRSNARSRQQTQPTRRARATRSSARQSRDTPVSAVARSAVTTRRVTRSTANRQAQLPLHNHGIHTEADTLREGGEMNDDDGPQTSDELISRSCLMTSLQVFDRTSTHQWAFTLPWEEPCDDSRLALRPGNTNAAFASPTPGFKKSPQRYSGKENSHILLKSPSSSSNPYFHTSGDSIDTSTYNPLYVPRDGFGYRLYSYDEEPKAVTPSGFQPINNGSAYDSTHISGATGTSYHHNQSGGDEYPL
ncbi:hypothetical protein F5Y19DRAFT_461089 [Xylariaceae sp. FL1651]|nr:hypothetical protein F5Y19DRAFT_461089 [Xylariaceae sp. FL1651]